MKNNPGAEQKHSPSQKQTPEHDSPDQEQSPHHQFHFSFHRKSGSLIKSDPDESRNSLGSTDSSSAYTSPTKSIKSFFKNRASAVSIESISEEPELQSQTSSKKYDLQPSTSSTQSPVKIPNPLSTLLKPSFIRSKSSFQSNNSGGQSQSGVASVTHFNPSVLTQGRPTTIDDFADTSSSSSDDEHARTRETDADSINAILDEYDMNDSRYFGRETQHKPTTRGSPVRADNSFIFKEIFDESQSFGDSDLPSHSAKKPSSVPANIIAPHAVPITRDSPALRQQKQQQQQPTLPPHHADFHAYHSDSGDSSKRSSAHSYQSSSIRRTPSLKETKSIVEASLAGAGSGSPLPPLPSSSIASKEAVSPVRSNSPGLTHTFLTSGPPRMTTPTPPPYMSQSSSPYSFHSAPNNSQLSGGSSNSNSNPNSNSNSNSGFRIHDDNASSSNNSTQSPLANEFPSDIRTTNKPVHIRHHPRIERRNVLSQSSNILDRSSSVYNMTSISDSQKTTDERYPEPDVTPLQTPQKPRFIPSQAGQDPISSDDSGSVSVTTSDVADISERPLRTQSKRGSGRYSNVNFDETLLNRSSSTGKDQSRNTFRSSISSGELLSRLENYYDGPQQKQQNQTQQASQSFYQPSNLNPNARVYNHDQAKNMLANLTAGPDSSSELPVMLYTVQDKDFNEGNQRWSVYESRKGINLAHPTRESSSKRLRNAYSPNSSSNEHSQNDDHQSTSSGGGDISPPKNAGGRSNSARGTGNAPGLASMSPSQSPGSRNYDYIDRNFNDRIGDWRHGTPRNLEANNILGNKPSYGAFSVSKPAKASGLRDSVSRRNLHDNMLDDGNREDRGTMSGDVSFDGFHKDLEKDSFYSNHDYVIHSWTRFILMMILGLIIPPIYFLVTLGAFDTNTHNRSQYYTGFYYQQPAFGTNPSVKQRINKRYSKTQKIISIVIGLLWFAIILAMIGVGLGIGLTRES